MNLTRPQFAMGKKYNLKDYQKNGSTGYQLAAEPNRVYFSAFGSYDLSNNESDPSLPGALRWLKSTEMGYGLDTTVDVGESLYSLKIRIGVEVECADLVFYRSPGSWLRRRR